MPDRWTSISDTDLVQAGHANILAKARSLGVPEAEGEDPAIDPVVEAIANAVARVRRAVRAGNPLDTDPDKVPASLKDVTVRRALFALMRRIGLTLNGDEKDVQREDNEDLKRLADHKILVEAPDDTDATDATLTPQNLGTWNSENKIVGRTHPVPTPGRQLTPRDGQYANPDAPEDTV